MLMRISGIISTFIYFYSILIVLRIFMSWLPNIDWDAQPMKFIRIVTDVYLEIFRRVIPPIGGLDFSPIVALIVLSLVQDCLVKLVSFGG